MARKTVKFEEALQQLNGIVTKLEEGDLGLDEAIKAFEEGVKLCRICAKKLDEAEKKVALLLKDQKGQFYTAPLTGENDDADKF